jgi:hypothetical protein
MNTLFEKLLQESTLSEKDKHDIKQIYSFLSTERQQRLMRNFETLCYNIDIINKDIATEQRILFENLVTDLDQILKGTKSRNIQNEAQNSILGLKGEL